MLRNKRILMSLNERGHMYVRYKRIFCLVFTLWQMKEGYNLDRLMKNYVGYMRNPENFNRRNIQARTNRTMMTTKQFIL